MSLNFGTVGDKILVKKNTLCIVVTVGLGNSKIFLNFSFQNSGLWRPNGAYGYDECGLRIKKTNIVGGETAKFGDYPYMALLGSSQQNPRSKKIETFYTCGGSLINKWYVLTAAHCVQTDTGDKIELR